MASSNMIRLSGWEPSTLLVWGRPVSSDAQLMPLPTKCVGSIGAECNDVTVRGGLGIDFIANF
jgi:hypothetical protein